MERERAENMNDSNARRQEFIKREKIIQVSLSIPLQLERMLSSPSDLVSFFVASSATRKHRLLESTTTLHPRHLVTTVGN